MNRSRVFRPDFVVALLAVVIGLSTMFVYIYQARIMSRQVHATTWPYLELNYSQGATRFQIKLSNKGVGPAIVKQASLIVDGKRMVDSQKNVDSLVASITGVPRLLNGYTNIKSRVLSAGDEITYIEIGDSASVKLFMQALNTHGVRLEICYCSVLDDCWLLSGGNTVACDSCK